MKEPEKIIARTSAVCAKVTSDPGNFFRITVLIFVFFFA